MTTARKKYNLQSEPAKMVLTSRVVMARVTGGVVTPHAVRLCLAPTPGNRIDRVQALAKELALTLGVPNVRILRQGSSVQLEIPLGEVTSEPVSLTKLRQILADKFDEDELRDLCFDLRVDYQDLAGAGKRGKARELVAYLDRRGRIHELVIKVYKQRPKVAKKLSSK